MSDKITLQEEAYLFIKSKILNLGFKPGEYITDLQIAESLNISRTPVLEREGLLIYEPKRGWKVYSLTLDDIKEIFEIKINLEALLARKAAQCTDKKLRAELKQTITAMREAADGDDVDSWVNLDKNLHSLIFTMADNHRAMTYIENLNDQWNRLRIGFSARTGRMGRSIIEHEKLVDAILSGDENLAEKETVAHLEKVRDELTSLLINMVLPYARDGI
jgi:DNA-binding GntR family transcriptional regulator